MVKSPAKNKTRLLLVQGDLDSRPQNVMVTDARGRGIYTIRHSSVGVICTRYLHPETMHGLNDMLSAACAARNSLIRGYLA